MIVRRWLRWSSCLLSCVVAGALAHAAETRAKVALTFDDLPAHGSLPPGVSRADVARSILAALEAHHAPPSYGFVNAKAMEVGLDAVETLRLWRAGGHPLANHTFSHMDLHANSAEAFEQDVVAGETTLRTYMGDEGWRWLRFPYLREGDTLEKRRAVAGFLKQRGYRVAQVTLAFGDWAYNDPYARCSAKNDLAAIAWMKESYLRQAAESINAGTQEAKLAYGRDIPHVLLQHIGAFDAAMLPALLELLERRGFQLVTLDEAQSDPAYGDVPDQAFPQGATLLQQVMETRHLTRPPLPGPADDSMARLEGLCR